MSDHVNTLFEGNSGSTCLAAEAQTWDECLPQHTYQQMHQQIYETLFWNRTQIYLENILPQWPIFHPDEVRAMRQRYLTSQSSDNDRLSLLVLVDLADITNPFHSQDILEIQFSVRYTRTLQIHALLALYWECRGFHSLANEHILKAFHLGMLSCAQWDGASLQRHFPDIVALWCCCFIVCEYPIHTEVNAIPNLYKCLPLPPKEDIIRSFGSNAGAFFELRTAYISPRLAAISRPQLQCPTLESIKVTGPLAILKDRYVRTHRFGQSLAQGDFKSVASYVENIQNSDPTYRRWAFPSERFCLYKLADICSNSRQRRTCLSLVQKSLDDLRPLPECFTNTDFNSICLLYSKLWAAEQKAC